MRYPFLENNFSLETTMSTNQYFDFRLLIDKTFLKDLINLFNQLCYLYSKVPVSVNTTIMILDQIIQIISDELHFIFIVIFFSLVAYKNNVVKERNDSLLKEYDIIISDILSKIKENTEKYKKLRSDWKSKLIFYSIPSNVNEFLNNLNNNLKLFPNLNFNLKQFFLTTKEINGTKLQRSYGKLIEISKPISQLNERDGKPTNNKTVLDNSTNIVNEQMNSKFEFSKDKFKHVNTAFDFEGFNNFVRGYSFENKPNNISTIPCISNNYSVGNNNNNPESNNVTNMYNQLSGNSYLNDFNNLKMTNNGFQRDQNIPFQRYFYIIVDLRSNNHILITIRIFDLVKALLLLEQIIKHFLITILVGISLTPT